MIKCFNFDGSGDEEDKEGLIKVKAMSISVSDIRDDGDVAWFDFMCL